MTDIFILGMGFYVGLERFWRRRRNGKRACSGPSRILFILPNIEY